MKKKQAAVKDSDIKKILLKMAENGEPRPEPGTPLGDALLAYTTPPKKTKEKKQ